VSRGFLGQCGLSLAGSDLNQALTLLPDLPPVRFQSGCFTATLKLPMGFGATLVIVPQSAPGVVNFLVPFDQIRGDRTGGIARMIAGGLWGVIRPQIEKMVRKNLETHGLPLDTLTVEQERAEGGGKVGRLVLRLQSLNAWLMRQAPVQGMKVTVDSAWVTEDTVNVILDVFQAA
jgi:hypothetical protein